MCSYQKDKKCTGRCWIHLHGSDPYFRCKIYIFYVSDPYLYWHRLFWYGMIFNLFLCCKVYFSSKMEAHSGTLKISIYNKTQKSHDWLKGIYFHKRCWDLYKVYVIYCFKLLKLLLSFRVMQYFWSQLSLHYHLCAVLW